MYKSVSYLVRRSGVGGLAVSWKMMSHELHMESTWRKPLVEVQRCEIVLPRWLYNAAAILIAGYVVYWLRDVLTPILLAFIIAYVLDPVVDRLHGRRVPPAAGTGIV